MFANPLYLLWGALAVAAAAGLFALGGTRREAATGKMGVRATLARLLPQGLAARRKLKAALSVCGLALLFLALAGPQWGVEFSPTESKAHEVVIAVDVSLSMLAEDVKPSRLAKAQEELSLLLDQLRGERVGVIAFAGDAYVMCPMTTDIDAAKQILRDLTPGSVPVPGTAIGTAIKTAAQTLSRYSGEKTLVLITDGEDHKTDPLAAAADAADAGVRIFAIGIGTPEGEPIPLKDAGGNLEGYKKDKRGATVVSKLGDKTLTAAAEKTGGAFYRSSPGQDEVTDIVAKIQRGETGEAVAGTQQHYQNRFMLPLALAFVLLFLEFCFPERSTEGRAQPAAEGRRLASRLKRLGAELRSALARSLRSRAGKTTATLAILLFLGTNARAATAEGSLRRGNKLYEKEQYEPALEQYAVAGQKSPRDVRPAFNAGDALYRLQRYDEATEAFKTIAQSKIPPEGRAAAFYNLGDTRYQAGDYAGAVEAFRGAVVLDPKDAAARNNLAVALKRLKSPPKDKKDDKKKKNQDKDKNKKEQDKPQPSGADKDKNQGRPPEPKTRPQDQMSREDAERIMRAVADKEKSASKNLQLQKQKNKPPEVEEDLVSALLLAAALLAAPARAQQLSISADVSKTEASVDEQITLAVTVTGPSASLPEPTLPRLDNFSVYSSGRSQNISFVNGQVSSSIVFSYVLVPRFVGKGAIGPISISAGGQSAQTSPIEITVVKPGTAAPSATQGRPAAPGGAPANARRARVFIKAELDKKKAFVNEQVTLSVKFYTAVNLLGSPQYVAPKTDGFIAEDLPPERHGNVVIQGQQYFYSEIKTALFPAHGGKLTVSPALVRCQIGDDISVDPFAPDFFDKFFGGTLARARNIELNSDALTIDAAPLPEAGKPKDFSGAVGSFSLAAMVDRNKPKVGEAVNLVVTVAGTGNLKAVGDPAIPDAPSFRKFDTVSSLNLDKKNDVVSGSKVFKTVLVPRVSGDIEIPAVTFSYFDVKTGAYRTAKAGPIRLKVAPGEAGAAPLAAGPAPAAPRGLTAVSEDIRYLKPARGEPLLDRALAALAGAGPLNAVPFALFLLAGAAEGLRARRESDPEGERFRGARRAALARVASARGVEPQKAAGLMAEALAGYLADKLGQPAAGLTLKRAQDSLRASCAPETLAALKDLWDELDMRRFAPAASTESGGAADALEKLFAALEKEIKR